MIYLVWGTKLAEIVVKRGQAHPDIPAGVIVAWGIKFSRRHAQFLKYEVLENFHPHRDGGRADLADGDFGLVPTLLIAGQVEKLVPFPGKRVPIGAFD